MGRLHIVGCRDSDMVGYAAHMYLDHYIYARMAEDIF